jgi:hypothetical protein
MSADTATPVSVQNGLEQLKIDEKLPSSKTPPEATPSAGSAISETATAPDLNKVPSSNRPRKLPFQDPALTSVKSPRAELTAEEQTKYDAVLEHMKAITSLPTSSAKKNKETAPLSELEQCFLTKECLLRYLRATKWNVLEAKKRLEGTIIWRREYGTDTLTAEHVEPEVSPLSPTPFL